jgi:hypothetical protein
MFEKGNELVRQLGEISEEKLSYYLDQEYRFVSSINEEILYNFQVLQNLVMISKNFNQQELSSQLDSLSNAHYAVFTAKVR